MVVENNVRDWCAVIGWLIDWLIEHGFTSAPSQYRLYGRRFLQVWWPNQQCQSTEGGWLVIQTGEVQRSLVVLASVHKHISELILNSTQTGCRKVNTIYWWNLTNSLLQTIMQWLRVYKVHSQMFYQTSNTKFQFPHVSWHNVPLRTM